MWFWDGSMGGWMIFLGILPVLFWGGLIVLIIWGVKKLAGGGSISRKDPLDIAKERYARGEISAEEYERIKRDLSS